MVWNYAGGDWRIVSGLVGSMDYEKAYSPSNQFMCQYMTSEIKLQ